jgi:hypothetical protein
VIRAWLSRRRTPGVHRSVDQVTFLGAQFDVRDAQIEGLRDALAEAHRQLAVVRAELATHKTRTFMAHALRLRARLAEEPTAHVTSEQLARSRPMDAPTEEWRTR